VAKVTIYLAFIEADRSVALVRQKQIPETGGLGPGFQILYD